MLDLGSGYHNPWRLFRAISLPRSPYDGRKHLHLRHRGAGHGGAGFRVFALVASALTVSPRQLTPSAGLGRRPRHKRPGIQSFRRHICQRSCSVTRVATRRYDHEMTAPSIRAREHHVRKRHFSTACSVVRGAAKLSVPDRDRHWPR